MKIATLLSSLLLIPFSSARPDADMLEIGDQAPMADYKMINAVDDESYSLADLKKENGLLVIFSCNTCPFVLAWEDQYPELGELTEANNLGMVLINSNTAKREDEDSKEAMKSHHKDSGYNTPYLIDKNSKLADAMGAATTPHVYLFNGDMELVYRGSINDKFEKRSKTAEKFYLKEAIEALSSGALIDPATTRQIGCSIKRV